MTTFKDKRIFEGNIADGNPCRQKYLESINKFIDKGFADACQQRDKFAGNIVFEQDKYRQRFIEMIGQPTYPYPDCVPNAKSQYVGRDDFGDIYRLQIEVLPDFWFWGLYMVPFNAEKAPLVIAQHGGGSTPEICSELFGPSNYNFFTKRALEKGMAVFAPQLLLWKIDFDTGEPEDTSNIAFDRYRIDRKLKMLGLSITGLEVFCIRRSIDYISSLEYIDENRIAMMGLSYGGHFSLYTAAAEPRIKSIYAAGFFNDRSQVGCTDWLYDRAAYTFFDAEVAALCAPRRLQIDVGKNDPVFDYAPSVAEGHRASAYYASFGASDAFRFTLHESGHRFDESEAGFKFFFDGI